jgi:hypothetical protein
MNVQAEKTALSRICQGDIIREVDCIEYVSEKGGLIEVSRIVFPLAIVLTQDCDLEQDHRNQEDAKTGGDKLLISVLVAPLYNAEHVYLGEHLADIGIAREPINSKRTPGRLLKLNERPRYHYLEFPPDIQIVPSVIDFKHYFSINAKYLTQLKSSNYVCTLCALYREDVSQRFASYLSRIGLPELRQSSDSASISTSAL